MRCGLGLADGNVPSQAAAQTAATVMGSALWSCTSRMSTTNARATTVEPGPELGHQAPRRGRPCREVGCTQAA